MTIGSFGGTSAGSTYLREMLYVDTGRVRSYLAQMEQGLPERVQQAEEGMRRWAAGVNLMAVRAEAGGHSAGREQTERTLSDLHFAIFEEVAEAVGFLTDVSDRVVDLDAWTSGRLHQSLQEGHAIRVTAPARLTDGEHIIALLQKLARTRGGGAAPGVQGEAAAAEQLYATMSGGGQDAEPDGQFLSEMEAMVRLLLPPASGCAACRAGPPTPRRASPESCWTAPSTSILNGSQSSRATARSSGSGRWSAP